MSDKYLLVTGHFPSGDSCRLTTESMETARDLLSLLARGTIWRVSRTSKYRVHLWRKGYKHFRDKPSKDWSYT